MKFEHLKTDLTKVKKYLSKQKRFVFYQDQIKGGYSLKVEYLASRDNAITTYKKLKRSFPGNVVRLLGPCDVRNAFSVRIWVK